MSSSAPNYAAVAAPEHQVPAAGGYTPALNYVDYVNRVYRFDKIRPAKATHRAPCISRAIGQIDMETQAVLTECQQEHKIKIICAEYYKREGVPIRRERPFLV